jgi:hypothetical protein
MKTGRLWSEDELTLALELYNESNRIPDARDPRVCELAAFIHRSEGAVVFKLRNLRRFETGKSGGAPHGSKVDAQVWDRYHDRPEELQVAVSEIRSRGACRP